MVGLAGIRRGADALDAQERELLVEVFAQVVVQPPVGRQADLASSLLGDSNEILQLVSLQRSVLVAADHAVDVEEEDAQAGRLRARLWGLNVGHWTAEEGGRVAEQPGDRVIVARSERRLGA